MKHATLLLDLDDTLIVEEQSAQESFLAAAEYLHALHCINSVDFVKAIREEARLLWHSLPTIGLAKSIGISSWEALWAEFSGTGTDQLRLREIRDYYRAASWSKALARFDIHDNDLAEMLSMIFRTERRKRHRLFDDTAGFLDELLRRGLKFGLITNGSPDLQREKIAESGIDRWISSIFISGEIGIRKPGRGIFEHALAALNASCTETVMAGDTLETDISGANDSGIKSVWINRDERVNDTDVRPAYECTGLNDLLALGLF